MHYYCKKYFLKFTSFFSLASFVNLLNLFVVVFIFCYQIIFIEIIIILKSNSLKILSFIEFSKMTILIFFSSIATFFAIKYIMFIFISKFSEMLYFDKHNIIKFFGRFKKLCNEYKIFIKKWWVKLSRYCERSIIEFMRISTLYINRNWIAFDKKM